MKDGHRAKKKILISTKSVVLYTGLHYITFIKVSALTATQRVDLIFFQDQRVTKRLLQGGMLNKPRKLKNISQLTRLN